MTSVTQDIKKASVWNLDAANYQRHALHGPERNFVESNCYIDIWVELIHALGLEVYPFLAFTLASDFEQDQWTFYKPSFDDLQFLYGITVQELYLWGPLHQQIARQLTHNKIVLLEADAFFLPDTQETDYQRNHVKTTIGIESIDLEKGTLGYFHNAVYARLDACDFNGIFHLDRPPMEGYLPPYCEIVKLNSLVRYPPAQLHQRAKALLQRYLEQCPKSNPIECFKHGFQQQLPSLIEQGLETYHLYAFGSLRQMGSCFEFSAYFLRAFQTYETPHEKCALLASAADHFTAISMQAKTLILKGARWVSRKTSKDLSEDFDPMVAHWAEAMQQLREYLND